MRFMSISKKLAIQLTLFSFVPVLAISIFIYNDATNKALEREFTMLEYIATSKSEFVSYSLGQERRIFLFIASRPLFRNSVNTYLNTKSKTDLAVVQEVMNAVKKDDGDIECMEVVTADGNVIASSDRDNINKNISSQKIFQSAKVGKVSEDFINTEDGFALRMATQIVKDSKPIGVLVARLKMSGIKKAATNYNGLGKTGETLIYYKSQNEKFACIMPHRFDGHEQHGNKPDIEAHNTFMEQVKNQPNQKRMLLKDYLGHEVLAVTKNIDGSDMSLVVKIEKNEVLGWIDTLGYKAMAIFLFCTIGIGGLIYYFTRSISSPIEKLTDFAKSISGGELHAKNDIRTNDEIGILANTLNETVAKLADASDFLELKINERTAELEKANTQLHDSEDLVRAILNMQDSLVVVTDGKKIFHANTAFFTFFDCGLEKFAEGDCFCVWLVFEAFKNDEHRCDGWLNKIEQHGWRVDAVEKKSGLTKNFIVVSKPFIGKQGQFVVTFTDVTKIQEEKDYFVHLAVTDTLTGLHNRVRLNDMLSLLVERAKRYEQPFCAIMIDLDHFKNINDTYGHQKGDDVLRVVSKIIKESIRASDFAVRYGGEEFVIIAPSTILKDAKTVAEKLRKVIQKTVIIEGLTVTASFGIAEFRMDDTAESILIRADELLYSAKKSGRNCIVV
jgi:two-component system, cell cycle response regulator